MLITIIITTSRFDGKCSDHGSSFIETIKAFDRYYKIKIKIRVDKIYLSLLVRLEKVCR